jgi:hypothetical protein
VPSADIGGVLIGSAASDDQAVRIAALIANACASGV